MIWFGWVLWHINHCRLFNAKSSLYIYIGYIGFVNTSTKLNGFKYCYVSLTIQLNISHFFIHNQMIKQFNLSHLFAHSLNIKSFYLTHG